MTTTRVQSRALEGASEPAEGGPKVHVVTFGCQMNKYDSELVEGRFRRRGWRTTGVLAEADVVLFNTCAVREHAEERTFSWLGELKHAKAQRPELVIGVMGCQAQREAEAIFARAGHVDLVCGTRRLADLPELVEEVRERRERLGLGPERGAGVLAVEMDGEVRVERAGEAYTGGLAGYLTVMRGCDLNCTYCVVPTTRGRVQSRPLDELLREARWMVDSGARAITLLGQTVNSYGEDLPRPARGPEGGGARGGGRGGRPGLADVVRALQELEGLERIRLITLHPSYLDEGLARALADCPKAERYLPLPAQSGSDRMLKAMKRGYTSALYRERMQRVRALLPDLELSSDWIVGFPGESDADHEASERFLAEQGFAWNYVFKYSPRPGTRAFDERVDDVPEPVKKERNARLLAVAERTQLARHQAHVGATRRVFLEQELAPRAGEVTTRVVGRSEHGLAVRLAGGPELAAQLGREVPVEIVAASPHGLVGALAAS